jgi:hypothetical protein
VQNAIATLLMTAAALAAQDAVPRYEVRRATSRIQIDGKLDESSWKTAVPLTFVFPWEDQKGAKQKTTVRVLWDDQYLYLAYDCEDSDVTAVFGKHDDPTYRDDAVELFISPNASDPSLYVGLEMNARAVLYDYLYVWPKVLLKRWDMSGALLATSIRGTLNARGDKDEGWSLELAIPWSDFEDLSKTLPPRSGDVWRANMNRWDGVEPERRLSQWSNSGMKTPNPHNPPRFGELVFLK